MTWIEFNFGPALGAPRRDLSLRSRLAILLYGLTLLLIHLGDARVLTRHEVLAAQPAREMLHIGTFKSWMLPTLAGLPRTAKPPGMMWLIAISMYIFRSDSEWVARMPSALAGFAVAWMIARLAARWCGDRIGRIAGLLQFTFVYFITQAKLAEADMALVASVCMALCAFAIAVIDSPFGLDQRQRTRLAFWLAAGTAFLLKGPIGLLFIALAIATFAVVRRIGPLGRRDWRILQFLADPAGIVCFLLLLAAWPLIAWRLDPAIIQTWNSEAIGTATGKFGSDPFYYYVWSIPLMLLPWAPFVVLGFVQGPNSEMTGPINEQSDRFMLWRFLLCWFVPGFLLLSFCIQLKSHHYAFPILPPLTIPAAVGFDFFVRHQTQKRQPAIWPIFLIGCIAAAMIVRSLPSVPVPMKQPIVDLIEIFAIGGLLALHWERARAPRRMKFAYFMTAWAIAVGVQSWVMPAQDDFRYQADLAKIANGKTPPGDVIYMLGHREEEQEAEYAYYLRFPMKRLMSIADVPTGTDPIYAIAPKGLLPDLSGAQILATCQGLRPHETESDRLLFLRISRASAP